MNQVIFVLSDDEEPVAHESDPSAQEVIILDFSTLYYDEDEYGELAAKIALIRDQDLRARLLSTLVEIANHNDVSLDDTDIPSLQQIKLEAAIAAVRAAGMQVVGLPA